MKWFITLLNRVQFTEMVEQGFSDGDLRAVLKALEKKRVSIILALVALSSLKLR